MRSVCLDQRKDSQSKAQVCVDQLRLQSDFLKANSGIEDKDKAQILARGKSPEFISGQKKRPAQFRLLENVRSAIYEVKKCLQRNADMTQRNLGIKKCPQCDSINRMTRCSQHFAMRFVSIRFRAKNRMCKTYSQSINVKTRRCSYVRKARHYTTTSRGYVKSQSVGQREEFLKMCICVQK